MGIFSSLRRGFLSCPNTTLKQRSLLSHAWVPRLPLVTANLAVSLVTRMHAPRLGFKKAHTWVEAVKTLASSAKRYPQTAYSGLQRSLQPEWTFVQRITLWTSVTSSPRSRVKFLTQLSLARTLQTMNPRLKLACLPVKHADLALSDPTASAKSYFDANILICSHLLAALRGREAFRTTDHQAVIHTVKPSSSHPG
jgi:hypothetical protein